MFDDKFTAKQSKQLRDAQIKVINSIDYIEKSEHAYPEALTSMFVPLDRIQAVNYGNCKEGFVLSAYLLDKLGYEVSGVFVDPTNKDPGHIVAAYEDKKTKLFGTMGISTADFMLPMFENHDEIALWIALTRGYQNALARKVAIDEKSMPETGKPLKFCVEKLRDVDLAKDASLAFVEGKTEEGRWSAEMYSNGYNIDFETLIKADLDDYLTGGNITQIHADFNQNQKWEEIFVNYIMKDGDGRLRYFFSEGELVTVESRRKKLGYLGDYRNLFSHHLTDEQKEQYTKVRESIKETIRMEQVHNIFKTKYENKNYAEFRQGNNALKIENKFHHRLDP